MRNYHRHSWLTVFSLIVLTVSLAFSSPAPAQDIKPDDIYREIGYIPMADGVKLAYINYRPKKEGKYPVLLIYNVYWGGGQDLGADEREYLRHGYAVLSVSVRGTGCSEGTFTSFFSPPEGKDGAAVVEWAPPRLVLERRRPDGSAIRLDGELAGGTLRGRLDWAGHAAGFELTRSPERLSRLAP